MNDPDKLIEYYYQRRLLGMELSEIEESLSSQMLDELRLTVLSEVKRREQLFYKALRRKKTIRYILLITIVSALLTGSVYFIPIPSAEDIQILLFTAGLSLTLLLVLTLIYLRFKK